MKKVTILLSSLLVGFGLNAQIFSDDFESYAVGSYLGPQSVEWTTWSGTEGGAEDVQISSGQASSGTNSIYFVGAAAGGPQDVVLDFGTQYTNGIFTYQSDFYVASGNNAYFNFQGDPVIGTTWAMNCFMENGVITIDDGASVTASGTYTPGTWFTLTIEANLSTGRWQASVDGACIGVWANGINSVASLDLYPIDASYIFYVDDVSFDWVAYTPSNLNAAVSAVDMGPAIAGLNAYPTVTVVNAGTVALNSFDVTLTYNGTPYTENVTGQNLTSGQTYDVNFATPIPLVSGPNTAVATVSNVNGGTDDDPSDDDGCALVDPITPAAGKVVVGEEGTGTWCGWCPRGAVFMDQYEADYGPYWAGIAVHNGDPMVVADYDTPFSALIAGYPSALVDRGPEVDPSAMSTDFFTRLQVAPAALMTNGATWNASTRELNVSITADFQTNGTSQYKMLCVLTEDGVTGSTSGYAQTNYYAGGAQGPMGGYESLPNPVPAAQMVYDHVARAIAPDFDGHNECFPTTFNSGEVITQNYTFILPASWDENNVHIIGMLTQPGGMINNADKTTINEAVANGFVNACSSSIGEILIDQVDDFLNIYPNPASTFTTIAITLPQEADVQLALKDMNGKVIASTDYGMIPSSTVDLNTSELSSGVYLVELTVNGQVMTKRLMID